jgi:hypothetical protein
VRKGGRHEALAINPQTAQRIRAYFEIAGHRPISTGRCSVPFAATARTSRHGAP